MRPTALLIALTITSAAHGQSIYTPGYYGAVGPYQQSRVYPGFQYYNHSAPYYPVRGYGYGSRHRTYLQEESLYELRQIRQELEDANWQRRWGRGR